MLFMVIERFKNRDVKPAYRRVRDQGRGLPEGLHFIDSWVEPSFERCFQLMETDDLRTLQLFVAHWSDLVDFEIFPVVPTAAAREVLEPLL